MAEQGKHDKGTKKGGVPAEKSDDAVSDVQNQKLEEPLDPRIRDGLRRLYSSVVDEPLPAKITDLLNKLREEEQRVSKKPSVTAAHGDDNDN